MGVHMGSNQLLIGCWCGCICCGGGAPWWCGCGGGGWCGFTPGCPGGACGLNSAICGAPGGPGGCPGCPGWKWPGWCGLVGSKPCGGPVGGTWPMNCACGTTCGLIGSKPGLIGTGPIPGLGWFGFHPGGPGWCGPGCCCKNLRRHLISANCFHYA